VIITKNREENSTSTRPCPVLTQARSPHLGERGSLA